MQALGVEDIRVTDRMIVDPRDLFEALSSVERGRLEAVRGHEDQAALLLARMTLDRSE